MEFLHLWTEIDAHAQEFARQRRLSMATYRFGPPSTVLVALAWCAGRLERLAATVEGWASGRSTEAAPSFPQAQAG